MKEIVTTAPGKILIAGEFAVLAGAPAISVAVNRRASVTIRTREADAHALGSPGYLDGIWRFRFDGTMRWLDPAPPENAYRLFECLVEECVSPSLPPCAFTVDTTAFHTRRGDKLGLGSSAAVAVALALACASLAGRAAATSSDTAGKAHRRFQYGRGSGVDVATARHGGVIRFAKGEPTEALSWPAGLAWRALWSGRSSSTRATLKRLPVRDTSASAASLAAASGVVADTWRAGNADETLRSMRAFVAALEAYDRERGVGIFDGGHAELMALSNDFAGLVYKPTGAGGGDIGLALGTSETVLDEFVGAAKDFGFEATDLHVDRSGARVAERAA